MTSRRVRAILAGAACVATLSARPCLGSDRGYDVWFAGHVLSVDAHRGRLRIARGPTETAGRGIEDCVVPGAALKYVRPGMGVEAQADTRRRPWRILHLRVMKRKSTGTDGATPRIAFVETSASALAETSYASAAILSSST
jgi:hypothetical protein